MEEVYDKCDGCPFADTDCPIGAWCTIIGDTIVMPYVSLNFYDEITEMNLKQNLIKQK